MVTINTETLRTFCRQIFVSAGASGDEAEIVADSLITSNLLGHDSHGIIRVMQYVRDMREGRIVPGAELGVLKETDTTLLLDGNWNFGQVNTRRAMEKAIEKARKSEVVQMGLRRANHIGRLGEYTQQAAESGMLGLMMVTNSGAGQIAVPFGGTRGRLATNPISFAAPWKDGQCLVLDMTTSIVPEGKIRVIKNKGEKVPEGWMLDSQGRPTTDPNDLYTSPRGSVFPLGGVMAHKGFGLSLMVEVFAGLMSGAGIVRAGADRVANGIFALVTDIEAFMPREQFDENIVALLDYIKDCPTEPGVEEILVPGEPEYRTYQKRQAEGFPIDDETWRQLAELGTELGVAPPGG